MQALPLILASSSPRRAQLLKQLCPDFRIVPAGTSELHVPQLSASELAQINASRKAQAVARSYPDCLVLGADTLVYLDYVLFGKPADLAQARQMLQQLQGHTHQVVTGVCLLHARTGRRSLFAELTDVQFRPLDSAQIEAYLGAIDPLDKAGAYAIQEHGSMLVQRVDGSFSNVVGLPLERLALELDRWKPSLP